MRHSEDLDICVDGYLPGESFSPEILPDPLALQRASHLELAVAWRKQWQPGQQLRVQFLDGDSRLHSRVEAHARSWLDYANLAFSFGNSPDAEIRISFKGRGYSSMVGTDAMGIAGPSPTMTLANFTADTPELLLRRTVLHEFGHAIGCIHEQASPAVAIPWNKAKVYEYYARTQGWDREKIERNVLVRYGSADTKYTEHDPASIMQYPVDKALTDGRFETGWNNDLSTQDKAFIAQLYPR
jgi:hypothetical protein